MISILPIINYWTHDFLNSMKSVSQIFLREADIFRYSTNKIFEELTTRYFFFSIIRLDQSVVVLTLQVFWIFFHFNNMKNRSYFLLLFVCIHYLASHQIKNQCYRKVRCLFSSIYQHVHIVPCKHVISIFRI